MTLGRGISIAITAEHHARPAIGAARFGRDKSRLKKYPARRFIVLERHSLNAIRHEFTSGERRRRFAWRE